MTNGRCIIDGIDYDISELGEDAHKALSHLNFLDKDILNLQFQLEINETAVALLKQKVRQRILAEKSGMGY